MGNYLRRTAWPSSRSSMRSKVRLPLSSLLSALWGLPLGCVRSVVRFWSHTPHMVESALACGPKELGANTISIYLGLLTGNAGLPVTCICRGLEPCLRKPWVCVMLIRGPTTSGPPIARSAAHHQYSQRYVASASGRGGSVSRCSWHLFHLFVLLIVGQRVWPRSECVTIHPVDCVPLPSRVSESYRLCRTRNRIQWQYSLGNLVKPCALSVCQTPSGYHKNLNWRNGEMSCTIDSTRGRLEGS